MKTALIWFEVPEKITYFIIDQDLSKFQGVYINSVNNVDLQAELNSIIYDETSGEFLHSEVTIEEIENAVREGAKLIEAGFYL